MAHLRVKISELLMLFSIICLTAGDFNEKSVVSAKIESCKGCQLNRLPEVKKFIYEDVPLFDNVIFKPIQGAPPELIFLNEKDQELERIALNSFSREQCNDLLISKGFSKRSPDTTSTHHSDF